MPVVAKIHFSLFAAIDYLTEKGFKVSRVKPFDYQLERKGRAPLWVDRNGMITLAQELCRLEEISYGPSYRN